MKFRNALLFITIGITYVAAQQFCQPGQYRTGTQADWDGPCTTPGTLPCFLQTNWGPGQCFNNGERIGCPAGEGGYFFRFTPDAIGLQSLRSFLPQTGNNMVLTQNYVNPGALSLGRVAGNTLALRLAVRLTNCNNCTPLGRLRVCEDPTNTPAPGQTLVNQCANFAGLTVGQIVAQAERAVGGCCNPSIGPCQLNIINQCLVFIISQFRGGRSLSQLPVNYFTTENQCPAPSVECPECEDDNNRCTEDRIVDGVCVRSLERGGCLRLDAPLTNIVGGNARGTATFWLDNVDDWLNYRITWTNLSSGIQSIRLFRRRPNGVIEQVAIIPVTSPGLATGRIRISETLQNALLREQFFVLISTNNYPAGELRGELVVA